MRFLIRKRRAAPAVIIVALIDVLVVLVIFLLVTTTFKQQPSFHVNLPESNSALKSGANENPPLVVNVDSNGVFRVGLENPLVMTPDQLRERLQNELAKNPQTALAIRADTKAPWGQIVKLWDLAKESHVKVLSAYTKEAKSQ